MRTWEDFKNAIKNRGGVTAEDIEEMEMLAAIVTAIIDRRNELGLSQRDLAKKCCLPQSSVARLEACLVRPKIETILRIMRELGLKLIAVTK